MIIQAYGLNFIRLKEEDIELVKHWRNSNKINEYMNYKGQITAEMQKRWFETINNISNYFFIVQCEQAKIGLIKLNSIDYDMRNAENGIFIWNDKYLGSGIPVFSMFMVLDFAFYFLGLQQVYGPVLKNNTRAIGYYQKLGAVITEEIDEKQIMMTGTIEGYESNSLELKHRLLSSYKKDKVINIVIEKQDFDNNVAQHLISIYDNLPLQLKEKFVMRTAV